MPSIKKEKTEENANRNIRKTQKDKKSIIHRGLSTTPSKCVYPVITRSKAKFLNEHLKIDSIIKSNQFCSRKKRRRKEKRIDLKEKTNGATPIFINNEMKVNSFNNVESSAFPSTSKQQTFSADNSFQAYDVPKETIDIVTNTIDSFHSEKMEIAENFASTSTRQVTEESCKINNEQTENNFEPTVTLTQQPSNQFRYDICDCQHNEMMQNVTRTTAENGKDINGLLTEEIWKTKQLYHLQEDIVRMEHKKLDTFKRIFKKLYDNLFFKNKTNI